jgi:hypothetical protein
MSKISLDIVLRSSVSKFLKIIFGSFHKNNIIIFIFFNFRRHGWRLRRKIWAKKMSYNVPAVYDVLAARIRALRSKDQGRQNVGGVSRGNGA